MTYRYETTSTNRVSQRIICSTIQAMHIAVQINLQTFKKEKAMKNILVIALCLSVFQGFAQKDSATIKQEKFERSMNATARGAYQTKFCGFRLSTVEMKFGMFISEFLSMAEANSEPFIKNGKGIIATTYVDKISSQQYPAKIKVQYNVEGHGTEFIINSVKITGNKKRLIDLFISYWNVPSISQDMKPGEVATFVFAGDKATLTMLPNRELVIMVTSQLTATSMR